MSRKFNARTAKPTNSLKLWQLLAIAMIDLRKQERLKGHIVRMHIWVNSRYYDTLDHVSCAACFAGSVLLHRCGMKDDEGHEIPKWALALNNLRQGDVQLALRDLHRLKANDYYDGKMSEFNRNMSPYLYRNKGLRWWKAIRKLYRDLKAKNI